MARIVRRVRRYFRHWHWEWFVLAFLILLYYVIVWGAYIVAILLLLNLFGIEFFGKVIS